MRKLIGTVVLLGSLSLLGACTHQMGTSAEKVGAGVGYAVDKTAKTSHDMVMGHDGKMHHKHHCKHHHKHHGKHHGKHHHHAKHHHKAHKAEAPKS